MLIWRPKGAAAAFPMFFKGGRTILDCSKLLKVDQWTTEEIMLSESDRLRFQYLTDIVLGAKEK
jgi:hypothetical protein